MLSTQVCQVGGRFSRCNSSAVQTCQYCGKPFCALHTYYSKDHEAVCSGKRCRAKHDDLQVHTEYKRIVYQRNNAGLCGIEDCGPHPAFQCSLCHGHFCAVHLTERMYPFREGWVAIERPVSICARCWERRKIWRGR
jgi:hypothetical protein